MYMMDPYVLSRWNQCKGRHNMVASGFLIIYIMTSSLCVLRVFCELLSWFGDSPLRGVLEDPLRLLLDGAAKAYNRMASDNNQTWLVTYSTHHCMICHCNMEHIHTDCYH